MTFYLLHENNVKYVNIVRHSQNLLNNVTYITNILF